MRESGCGWLRSSGRPNNEIVTPRGTLFALAQASFLLAEPLFPKHPCRRAEPLEYVQRVPNGRHEPLFERGHEDAIRDPVGGVGGRLTIRDHFKLLHDRPGFEAEFADPLEKENCTVGGFLHGFYLCVSACAFMAAGSVAEGERFKPRKRTPALAPSRL